MAESGLDLRRAARAGWDGLTVGRARGFVQANLVVVPVEWASDFAAFCQANPRSCPLLAAGEPGDPRLPDLDIDLDVTGDLPAYLVHETGKAPRRVPFLGAEWRPDWTPFAVGCWFGAEAALAAAGIRLRHVELGIQGALFRTGREAVPAGRLHGPLVVSMRPFAEGDVARVAAITARLPRSHSAPLHIGDPAALGIADPGCPDWGGPLLPEEGESAVFWGCGLTALAALQASGVPLFATHAPGAMLVTNLPENVP
ncbi:D-glutamate cyclase family protein [Muricoccus aerilatus]|uniref:D-glutamate cyclase family protein n=1 Tax=Muricoccus aerilatus TaxID=452982 RepID=UPI0005C18002|nr:DUF1445 domain-containing protein [Roseomonas aerilata]